MILQILTYTHHITTMLFGIFLSAFFLGVKQDKKNVLQLLLLAAFSGILYIVSALAFGTTVNCACTSFVCVGPALQFPSIAFSDFHFYGISVLSVQ